MLQQITPKASLQQVMLNFGNHKKVERAINSLLKNQNSEISFYNLNLDLVKGENRFSSVRASPLNCRGNNIISYWTSMAAVLEMCSVRISRRRTQPRLSEVV